MSPALNIRKGALVSQDVARPFIKWAGGKTQLLPELRRRVPSDFNRYIEPFVGGGALFFDLRYMGTHVGDPCAGIGGVDVILNDSNAWLAATYKAVRDNVEGSTQRATCSAKFAETTSAINVELDAVGGFATTSPEWKNGKGYCRDFTRQAESFGGGVLVVGEEGPPGKVAPYEPEVGDRCFVLDKAWRERAYDVTRATQAVAAIVRPFASDAVSDEALVAAAEAAVKYMEET